MLSTEERGSCETFENKSFKSFNGFLSWKNLILLKTMLSELQKTNKKSVIINIIIPQLLHAPFTLYLNDVVGVGSIDRTFIEN